MGHSISWINSQQFPDTKSALYHWKNVYDAEVPPRGYIWLVHGLGEHLGRYGEFAAYCCNAGFDVLGIDLPGHGLSQSEGGQKRLSSVDESLGEVKSAWRYFFSESKDSAQKRASRWNLFCHSMGGVVGLKWVLDAQRTPGEFAFAHRAIVSAPALKLKMEVPLWKQKSATLLEKLLPDLKIPNGLSAEQFTRDVAIQQENRMDKLCHKNASPRVFLSMESSAEEILSRSNDVDIPICLLVGDCDPIVDTAAVEEYYSHLNTHKKILKITGGLHESLNELGREETFKELLLWLTN